VIDRLRIAARSAALALVVVLSAVAGAGALEKGQQAPDVTLRDLAGGTWSTKALRGQVVHVVFVASWCDPCGKEAEGLRDLWARYRRAGYTLLVVGVPARENADRLRAWAEQVGLTRVPVCFDEGAQATMAFGADFLPLHVLIDRKGLVDRVDGHLGPELADRVEELVGEKPGG